MDVRLYRAPAQHGHGLAEAMARLGGSFGDRMSPDLDLAWATVAARDVVWTGVLFSGAKDLLPSRPVRSAARSTPHRVGARRAATSPIARTILAASGDIECPWVIHEHAEDIAALPSAHAHSPHPTCRGVIEGLTQSTLNDRKPSTQRRALVPVLTVPSNPVPLPVHLLREQTQSRRTHFTFTSHGTDD